ncbi:MAG: serine/threonine protein kinase [Polyangiaceae bacterium]|nr:serine/threonine protein kinase [Polyangiaceae bacterium]
MAKDVFGIVGTSLRGLFAVEQVVAEGGFGIVYRARHQTFQVPIALKCLKMPATLDPPRAGDFLEHFRVESQVLFQLSAALSAVVRPLHADAFMAPNGQFVPFFAMEWLDGDTLGRFATRRRHRGTPVTLKRIIRLLGPVAEALHRAHQFHVRHSRICVVHGDLKPDNLFVTQESGFDQVKILDFGVGTVWRLAGAGDPLATCTASRGFSPPYGAPEQWRPQDFGPVGPHTDVWGLALTMVETLAGRPIIDGDELTMQRCALDPERRPTPRTEGLIVNDEVETVFARALALDPRDRLQTIGEFWPALIAAVGEVGPSRDTWR